MLSSALACSLACMTVSAGPQPAYVLEVAPARRVEAVLTYDIQIPQVTVKEWIVYVAKLPELPCQTKVSSKLEPGGKEARELGPLRRPVLLARLSARGKEMEKGLRLHVTHEATLMGRNLVPLPPEQKPPDVAPLPRDARRAFLAAGGPLDFQGRDFQKWLDAQSLRRKKDEAPVDFARRAFLHIKKNFTYEFKEKMDRKASVVCGLGRSDCGGLAMLLVSVLRANDVPARLLVGRWAASLRKGLKIGDVPFYQTHTKAEFFADGIGWVPMDIGSGIVHDKTAEGLLGFGRDPGDFIVFHVDADLLLDTFYHGKKSVEWLQSVAFWVTGTGSADERALREDWQVQIKP